MISICTLSQVIASSEYIGGETHPEGDSVQYRTRDGQMLTVHLSATSGDVGPSDEDVLCFAVRAGLGKGPTPSSEAEPVTKN